MNRLFFLIITILVLSCGQAETQKKAMPFFGADNSLIQYTGRIDFSDAKLPRFWQPGVYIDISFEGSSCEVMLNDELLGGVVHNYIEVIVDGKEKRLRLQSAHDTIEVASGLGAGVHRLQICKNTEANIGYLEFVGLRCDKLVPSPAQPTRRIEYIGNSITCGAGSDASEVPCGAGRWEDQHNAYLSYGARTARALDASYHLSSVSGIGLMHSCCNLPIVMPEVFNKVNMYRGEGDWDFKQYQPDVVTICLGQNDGIQDSTAFCGKYLDFLKQLRGHYPNANFVCLNSPMADEALTAVLRRYVSSVVKSANAKDSRIYSFFFSRRYFHGCDTHPNVEEHAQMSQELTAFLKQLMKW